MAPIAPIAPVDEALKLFAPGASGNTPPAVTPELRAQFEALMQKPAETAPSSVSPGPNVLTSMIQQQQSDIDQVESASQKFLDDAPGMSTHEVVSAGMALSHSFSLVNMKMQVATSLTQGSNKSLQTLLKNQ